MTKLKLTQIRDVNLALSQLDGYNKLTKDGDNEKVIFISYDFDAKTRWNIARNLTILKSYIEDFDKVRTSTIKSISGKQSIDKEDVSGLEKFTDEINKVLTSEVELEKIFTFKKESFKIDKNPIPSSLLTMLQPVIEDWDKE